MQRAKQQSEGQRRFHFFRVMKPAFINWEILNEKRRLSEESGN